MDTKELYEKKKAACLAISKILKNFSDETDLYPCNISVKESTSSEIGGRVLDRTYYTYFDLGVDFRA